MYVDQTYVLSCGARHIFIRVARLRPSCVFFICHVSLEEIVFFFSSLTLVHGTAMWKYTGRTSIH